MGADEVPARLVDLSEVDTVRAAGGLVCRPGPGGLTEVAVIHRPGYGDWSFPKGKLEGAESLEEAALREVTEETGLACRLVRSLGCTSYVDRKGRDKTVCYWLMEATGGRFRPGTEVDQMRWLTFAEAAEILTYDRDRQLLQTLVSEAA